MTYELEVRQTPDKWEWRLTTKDYENHPVFRDPADGRSPWRETRLLASRQVSGKEKTAERAIQKVVRLASQHIEMDLIREMRASFEKSAPTAKAKA